MKRRMNWQPNAVLCFVRARLRRRLFVWFAMTIVMTAIMASAVMVTIGGGTASWTKEMDRTRTFISDAFAHAWSDPVARAELAVTIQKDFDVSVRLRDEHGTELVAVGPACSGSGHDAPVVRDGHRVGTVSICSDRFRTAPWKAALIIFVVGCCFWAAAGKVARRLSHPIAEIARVASEIGSGNLDARVKISRHHHGELGIVACAMNDMAQRIEAQIGGQRKLLASVSHELRTPLARIRLLTEMGREQTKDPPSAEGDQRPSIEGPLSRGQRAAKTFDELDREVMEMDALVGDLLASSRMDFQVSSKRSIDVVEAAGRALDRAGEDPAKLVVETTPPALQADATLLARALANLIENAKKHGGGLDALRIERRNGHVVLSAEDHGTGFVDDERERVFEPFFKRGDGGNLGLGLALVKRIAEAHQGSVFAENRTEGGARVGIELPV
jgi:two-component system OmpR family sensor kinase